MANGRPMYVLSFLTGSELYSGTTPATTSCRSPRVTGSRRRRRREQETMVHTHRRAERVELPRVSHNLCVVLERGRLQPHSNTLQNTVFGQMLPFTFAGWYSLSNGDRQPQPTQFDSNGNPPLELFSYPVTYQLSSSTSPFQIAFRSSSLNNPIACGGTSSNPIDCFTIGAGLQGQH